MGAVNSCCIPRYTGSEYEGRSSKKGSMKGHRRNLSATFNMSIVEEDRSLNLVDINFATEEELMTLSMINRQIAQNIIEYRRQIGGFKKIEDLALVSGVGATKLTAIRNEIYVNRRNTGSSNSPGNSLGSSKQDLSSSANSGRSISRDSSFVKINVNTANIFQLMKIKGVGQVLAENIVTYREKKGLFFSIDDLVKVKGIGAGILGAIKHQIILDDISINSTPNMPSRKGSNHSNNRNITNVSTSRNSSNHSNGASSVNNNTGHHTPNCPVPSDGNDTPKMLSASVENILDIIKPIVNNSKRPNVSPFLFKRKNRGAFRLASWNIERFSSEKADNVGVKEVVCLTILENG